MRLLHKLILPLGLALLVTACGRDESLEIPTGSEVAVQQQDGVEVRGRLVEVGPDRIVIETNGVRRTVPRHEIRGITAASLMAAETAAAAPEGDVEGAAATRGTGPAAEPAEDREGSAPTGDPAAAYREVRIPAGTLLPAALQSSLASDETRVEAPVRATLRRAIRVDGVDVIPAGATVHGVVTNVERSGRVKGRASLSFRFTRIDTPEGGRAPITTSPITRVAPGTRKKDAATIGVGAAGGAVVGGLLGGGDGAAKGAAAGGAAGTGVVLATRGEEVRLKAGTPVSVRLSAPLIVRVKQDR